MTNRLELFCRDDEVEVRITDHTAGFDLPEKIVLPPVDREKGRGLFLIQSMASEVEYLRGRRENCMVIRRRRPASAAASASSVTLENRLLEDEQTLQAMTEELASCYESLSAMFRFSAALNRLQQTEEFATTWMRELLTIVEADWYRLLLADPEGRELRVAAASLPAEPDHALPLSPAPPDVQSVELRAAMHRQDVWIDSGSPH